MPLQKISVNPIPAFHILLPAFSAIYQLINKTKVQVKINKSDLFKDMKLVEIKKSDSSYQEIYELEEANIKSAQPKIIVEKGDKWTAIKRPSMIFRYDAESNEPQA